MKENIKQYVTLPMLCISVSINIIGLVVVFVVYRKVTKPIFVKVAWVLVTIATLLDTSRVFTFNAYNKEGKYTILYYSSETFGMLLN